MSHRKKGSSSRRGRGERHGEAAGYRRAQHRGGAGGLPTAPQGRAGRASQPAERARERKDGKEDGKEEGREEGRGGAATLECTAAG